MKILILTSFFELENRSTKWNKTERPDFLLVGNDEPLYTHASFFL